MIELEDRSGSDGPKRYKLTGKLYLSEIPGTLGGHKELKIYERLDCLSALLYIAKGQEKSQESPEIRAFLCVSYPYDRILAKTAMPIPFFNGEDIDIINERGGVG